MKARGLLGWAFVLAAAIVVPASAAKVSSSVPNGWIEDFKAAKKEAAASGKYILLAFSGSDWCGWCKKLEKEVFSQSEFVRDAQKAFVLTMIDNPRDKSILSKVAERQNNTTFRTAQDGARAIYVDCKPTTLRDFELTRQVNPHPFIPAEGMMTQTCEEILNIQTMGLVKRLQHTHCDKAVIGISGGLDSTLALLVTVRAFDKLGLSRRGIIGITMPGFGTTDRTHRNAVRMMDALGVTQREISIAKAVTQHFEDIGHNAAVHDVTYENAQARERTQILMDVANQVGGLVIGTGDLSELALGWCTYNGDHMSMYGVNAGVPKTLVQFLIRHISSSCSAETSAPLSTLRASLEDVLDTPISPELTPADAEGNIQQKTEDLVGPYELHDFFLYYIMRYGFRPAKVYMLAQHAFRNSYDDDTLRKWLHTFCRRFFNQQFKRSCMPDGPKVGSVSLSPRGDWRMPSDAASTLWLKEIEA